MDNFRRIFSTWIFWRTIIVILAFGGVLYVVLGRSFESTITQENLKKQQVVAKAQASNTISYFQSFGNTVATLAQLNSVIYRNENIQQNLDTFVEQRRESGIVAGVILTDKDGVVTFNANVSETSDIGQSLADRDFFVWAKTKGKKGKYFISKPVTSRLGASKGQTIVVVASPVYQNGNFTGVVGASLLLEKLVERFFGLMTISQQTETYLIDTSASLLYSSIPKETAQAKIAPMVSNDQRLRNHIKNAAFTENSEGQFTSEKYLVAYAPILLGTQNWLLLVSSPLEEIEYVSQPFYVREVLVVIFIIFNVLLYGIVSARRRGGAITPR